MAIRPLSRHCHCHDHQHTTFHRISELNFSSLSVQIYTRQKLHLHIYV